MTIMTRCLAIAAMALTAPVEAQDVTFDDFRVYEFEPARFAPNDTKPTLYKIKLVGKESGLWIEGADYNYQWLTIVPYEGIHRLVLNRTRLNPFVTESGWVARQLARAGDINGWFTIGFKDRKGNDREVVLLAPVNGEQPLVDYLEARATVDLIREGEAGKPSPPNEPAAAQPPAPAVSPSPPVPPPAAAAPAAPAEPVRVIDLMSVRAFRAAGLDKLTEPELAALDAWLNEFLSSRGR